jgi:hypothetical protein
MTTRSWQPIDVSAALFGALLILLTCLSGAARAQDCTAIGGGYDSHGNYDYTDFVDPRSNAALKEAIKKANITAAYTELWQGGDPRILVKTWPHVGLRLFHSMLLQKAVANTNARQVRELLRMGVYLNLDAQDSMMTPLITAIACASPEITLMLLHAGADANQASWFEQSAYGSITNYTPLMAAEGELKIVQALLKAGANPNAQELYVDAATNKIQSYGTVLLDDPAPPIIAALLKAGADPNLADYGGQTPLIAAASNGDYEGCYLLLKAGADKRRKDSDGDTAAAAARKSGYPDLADAIENWTPKTPKSSWPHRHGKAQ